MLALPLAQSDNVLPSNPKSWKIETLQNESGFLLKKVNMGILRMITASYCRDYKLTIVILKWVIDSLMEWCLW